MRGRHIDNASPQARRDATELKYNRFQPTYAGMITIDHPSAHKPVQSTVRPRPKCHVMLHAPCIRNQRPREMQPGRRLGLIADRTGFDRDALRCAGVEPPVLTLCGRHNRDGRQERPRPDWCAIRLPPRRSSQAEDVEMSYISRTRQHMRDCAWILNASCMVIPHISKGILPPTPALRAATLPLTRQHCPFASDTGPSFNRTPRATAAAMDRRSCKVPMSTAILGSILLVGSSKCTPATN